MDPDHSLRVHLLGICGTGMAALAGILKELRPGAGRRPAVLSFPELINIAEGRKVL